MQPGGKRGTWLHVFCTNSENSVRHHGQCEYTWQTDTPQENRYTQNMQPQSSPPSAHTFLLMMLLPSLLGPVSPDTLILF
ncbi:hypothetical protein FKM82_026213 [Ascaphus truei]